MFTAYDSDIKFYAERANIDPILVTAVVLTESNGKAHAYRYEDGYYHAYIEHNTKYKDMSKDRISASYGLMQIMFLTAVDYGFPIHSAPEELFLPATNLIYGCKILRSLLTWAGGDVNKALCAYNGGRGATAREPYPNQAYADKVLVHVANQSRR